MVPLLPPPCPPPPRRSMCREEYPPCVRWILWVIIEASLMGVEIQYVIGAGVGLSLMCDGLLPLWAAVLVCGGLAYLTLMMDRYGVKAVSEGGGCRSLEGGRSGEG